MPTLTDLVARFPLVPRPRPACLPLPQRIRGLTDLAQTAAGAQDPVRAAAVYNQAALLASDIGLPDLASELCHQHAHAYLHAAPLPADTAVRALEPVVNLARLHIRDQRDNGLDSLLRLFTAVSTGAADRFDDLLLPANLIQPAARQEVRAWLWRILLADGARALTTTGRWNEALAHVQEHRGIGTRMLDGRQIAVIAALTNGETATALQLIAETHPGEPWERAVTALLHALCHHTPGDLSRAQEDQLATAVLSVPNTPGTAVFDVRLRLTALRAIGSASSPAAQHLVAAAHQCIVEATDGYTASEFLDHQQATQAANDRQIQYCKDLVTACGLHSAALPPDSEERLANALRISGRTIRSSLGDHRV
ncbi:hypothetical protein AB0O57_29290 [Streptomyces sp. NPDC091201]|uniref:hypothetical protein n=1 Tax=Streptomyces sp. NPDC091201 TaxID=3155190 RepID=UPI00343F6CDF